MIFICARSKEFFMRQLCSGDAIVLAMFHLFFFVCTEVSDFQDKVLIRTPYCPKYDLDVYKSQRYVRDS